MAAMGLHNPHPVANRHFLLYTPGIIPLTVIALAPSDLGLSSHGRTPRTSLTRASRSSTRKSARPAEMATKGSGATRSVHLAGTESSRPSAVWKKTRSSPQVLR